nr:putative GTP diphosphokinase RSH1, chloroplastic [Ipomoea batatas]
MPQPLLSAAKLVAADDNPGSDLPDLTSSCWHVFIQMSYAMLNVLHINFLVELAFEAHDGQKCCSGEPFTIHPVAVAQILGELELDWESIAVGLLHDTVEDTNVVGTTCLS